MDVNTADSVQLSVVTADVTAMSRERVAVPRNSFQPCSTLDTQLTAINPLLSCQDNGKRMYNQCIHIVGQHLDSGCTNCLS